MLKVNNTVIGIAIGTTVIAGTGFAVYKNREELRSFANKKAKAIARSRGIKNTTKGIIHLNDVMVGKKKRKDIDLGIANLLIAYPTMEASDNEEVHDTLLIMDIAVAAAEQKGIDIDVLTEFSQKLLRDYMEDVIEKSGEDFDLSEKEQNEVQAAFCEGMKTAMGMDEEEPVNV